MTTKRPSDFVIRERIAAVTDPRLLRHLLTRAQGHVAEAKFIGWPALAQSWQIDVDAIKARMVVLGVGPGIARVRRDRSEARKAEEVCA